MQWGIFEKLTINQIIFGMLLWHILVGFRSLQNL